MEFACLLKRSVSGFLATSLFAVSPGHVLAVISPVGTEFVVNTYTSAAQEEPAIGIAGNGDFVLAWQSRGQLPGEGSAIFAQRFASDGSALGTEFQVSTNVAGTEYNPALASSAAGDFVIAWQGFGVPTGDLYEIVARRYSSAGSGLGTEFTVNTYTTQRQAMPSLAAAANGDFVAVWESEGQDGGNRGVFGQRFASDGSRLGSEFQVNTYTPYNQLRPTVSASPTFQFVVAWEGRDGEAYGIFAQRFASDGSPLGSEFQVNTYTSGNQMFPSLSTETDGDFIIAWGNDQFTNSGFDVAARRFDSEGSAVGTEFQVNTYTTSDQNRPSVQLSPNLGFVVAWQSDEQEGAADEGIFARCLASDGTSLGSEFQINSYTTNAQWGPLVGALPGGDFVIAWQSGASGPPYSPQHGRDGALSGVSAQRFAGPFGCSTSPLACASPGKAVFKLKKNADAPEKSVLVWKWLKGTIASAAAFGDPTQTTGYALCLYDDGTLEQQHAIAGDGTCDDKACWKSLRGSKGYKYVNKGAGGDGITLALLKSGAGNAKVVVKGKGPGLPVPATDPLFDQTEDLVVQLQSSDQGCWEATFPAPAVKATAETFKDKIL